MGREKKMIRSEFYLPEEIIQHIQSFMDIKQAAGTCLLSKSWYHAWSTGPNLTFDIKFKREKDDAAILDSIRTSMKRYQESNIKLQKLYFCVRGQVIGLRMAKYDSLINEFLRKHASELCINELHLECIDTYIYKVIHVPARVFAIPSLTKLSISGCRIYKKLRGIDTTSRLLSLCLDRVNVDGDESIIPDILLQCPSIENLELKDIKERFNINLHGLHNLVCVRVHNRNLCLKSLGFQSFIGTNVPEFHKLRIVCLKGVRLVGWFFTNFSSRFPCIEELSLDNWGGGFGLYDRGIQISSKSLKYLNLVPGSAEVEKAEFDVPNICKFGFKSNRIPTLSFSTVSKEWESKIEFGCGTVDASVFERLRELRKELNQSRIYLHLNLWSSSMFISGDLPSLPSPATVPLVENLTVEYFHPQKQTFLTTALFRYCRPKSITLISPPLMSLSETIDFAQQAQDLFADQKNATECSSMMQSLIKYDIKKFEYTTNPSAEGRAIELRNFVNDLNLGLKRDLIKSGWFRVVWGTSNVAEPSFDGN